jgi:CRP-like cAMP-binding protein
VIVNDEAVASIGDGKSFGELALLYNTPRQATIRSQGVAQLFSLDRATFRYTLAKTSSDRINNVQGALSKVSLLTGLTQMQLHKISQAVEIQKFEPGLHHPRPLVSPLPHLSPTAGQIIIEKGSEGNVFYMIHEGTVSVTDVGSSGAFNDHTLSAGSYFGERALITGEPRAANVIATTPTTLMALDRESFTSLLGPLREVLDHNLNMRVLENIKLFSNLTEREKSKVSRSFEFETFSAGTHIIREGEKGKKFYILKEGSALVTVGEETISTLQGGQYFGEMALLDDEMRKASVIATDCECFVLDRSTFTRILGSLQSIIARETEQRKNELHQKSGGTDQSDEPIAFEDLKKLAILGAGTFGRVSLVQHRSSGAVYALKAMSKSHIVQNKQQRNVMQEKTLMIQFHHPFVLRLYQTYQDSTYLYMLLEFIQGGELFSVIHTARSDGISVAATKFYSCCIFLGLAYLHSKDISYRDMKPENCLIDSKGYPKLVDFGFSKVITSKSYTLCGTPESLNPHLSMHSPHTSQVPCS